MSGDTNSLQRVPAALMLPTELLLSIFAHFDDGDALDRSRALYASALVCRRWYSHGANAALYASISLSSGKAIVLLDRSLARNPSLGIVVSSLNLLPTSTRPSFRQCVMVPPGRYLPDDARASDAVLRILRRTPRLQTLALNVVESVPRRVTFASLATNIASRCLRRLSLSGVVSGQRSGVDVEPLLALLCSSACFDLQELVLQHYMFSIRSPWDAYRGRLPPIRSLWLSRMWCVDHSGGQRDTMMRLPLLFNRTLTSLTAGDCNDVNSWPQACTALSEQSWPRLTSLRIPCSVLSHQRQRGNTLDLSLFPNLRHLETTSAVCSLRNNECPIDFPGSLRTLVLVTSMHAQSFSQMRSIGLWLRRRPASLSRLVHLRIRVSCGRAPKEVQTWQLLIAALAARERSLVVSGEIWLDPQNAAEGGGNHNADSKRSSSGWFQSLVPWASSLS